MSTEDLHSTNNLIFYGKYKKYRELIDYNFFKNYTETRQVFHDQLLDQLLNNKKAVNKPWAIYLCGCYGCGKSHSIKHLDNMKYINISDYVYNDPDKIKDMLPETKDLIKTNKETAGFLLHKEAGYISLLLQYICLDLNIPTIVDGSLHDVTWFGEFFENMKKTYKHKLCIIRVNSELNLVHNRCCKREKETGRHIPKELIEKIYYKIPDSFDNLKSYADLILLIENNEETTIKTFICN